MTSRGYGLPLSVVLFGTIYAIALAVAPKSSSAASQTERAHEARQIDHGQRPVAHKPPVLVVPNTQTLRAGADCQQLRDAARAGPVPALTLRRALFVPEGGLAAAQRLMSGGQTTLF